MSPEADDDWWISLVALVMSSQSFEAQELNIFYRYRLWYEYEYVTICFVLKNMHTGAARFCAKCILVYVLFMHFGDRYCPDHCWYQRRNVSLEYRIIQSDFKIQFETYGAVPLSSSLQLSMLMVLFWALSALCVCIVFVMIAVVKRKNVWLRMERLFGIIYAAPSFLANNVSSISVPVKQFNLPFC